VPVPTGGEPTVTLAAVAGAHGIGGEVKLKFFTDDLGPYKSFNNGALTLKSLRGNIARFAEVPDRTAAERLRGTALTIPRSALPPLEEGEYYHADLIGLPCIASTGEALGMIIAVENFGAGDIIEVERPAVEGQKAKRFMAPMHAVTVGDDSVVIDALFTE
jgi:16S rRNA processing protein RimM